MIRNILEYAEETAKRMPDAVAFATDKEEKTFGQLVQRAKEIGSALGKDISLSVSSTNGSNEKYYVVHSVTSESKDQLDADIIYIGSSATVDHVDNLRRIISGYLQSAYNYSEKDANRVMHQLVSLLHEMDGNVECIITLDRSFEAPES